MQIFTELAVSGVKVLVAGSAVSDLAMHFLDRLSIVVVKVLSKFELRRLCRVVGATPLARLGAPTPEEMGYVDVLEAVEIGGDRVTVFRQDVGADTEASRTCTIVVRGGTTNAMDDVERAIDDGAAVGVDIEGERDGTLDARKAGILDIATATEWALRYGTEAAMTVLRVDSIIMSKAVRRCAALTRLISAGRHRAAQATSRLGSGLD